MDDDDFPMAELSARKGLHEWLNTLALIVFGVLGVVHSCGQNARLETLEDQALVERLEGWRAMIHVDPARVLRESESWIGDPPDSRVLTLRGEAQLEGGDVEGALSSIRQAVERDGESFEAQFALGTAFRRMKDDEQAIAAFEKALEISGRPGSTVLPAAKVPLLIRLAGVYIDRNRTAEAEALLERAQEIEPNEGAIQAMLARAHRADYEFSAALRAWERVRQLEPESLSVLLEIAATQFLAGDYAAAANSLEDLRDRDPQARRDAEVKGALLAALRHSGQHEKMRELRNEIEQDHVSTVP